MDKNLIMGGIYSKFHGKLGPRAVVWYPEDLGDDVKNLVSLKTINILSGEGGEIPKSLAVIPFPSINMKGLVKSLEIKDPTQRGGAIDASVTLLFNEVNDIIFYKYIKNFEEVFDEAAKKIKELEEAKADKKQLSNALSRYYSKVNHVLDDLREAEISGLEKDAFPTTEKVVEEKAFRFKIIVCGDPAVGKTSTVLRFTDRAFKRTYIPTIGVNITEKKMQYERGTIIFILWDIAGQSKFQKMRRHFYQGADGILLVFDLTREETLDSVEAWYKDIVGYLKDDIHGFVIGNKCDLLREKKENTKARKIAQKLGLDYLQTSAFTGENVDEAFTKLGEKLRNIK
ncbi:MAG: Rab family GTPase [Candidatus Helarchaeota archaeon]